MSSQPSITYAQKMAQADREAKATVVGLALTVIVWLVAGIGLSGLDVQLFHTPLWIITGCFGTWIFAIIVAVFLCRRVITDVPLSEEGDDDE